MSDNKKHMQYIRKENIIDKEENIRIEKNKNKRIKQLIYKQVKI